MFFLAYRPRENGHGSRCNPHDLGVLIESLAEGFICAGLRATAAGLVVPKKYLEQVGEDGFKKHPIGLGPFKFVSFTPGVGLVLEAFEGYWQKVPHVKRLIIKGVPEGTTRLAMLKAVVGGGGLSQWLRRGGAGPDSPLL